MKSIFYYLMFIPLALTAQKTVPEKLESNAEKFSERSGSLIQKEFLTIGEIAKCKIEVVHYADLISPHRRAMQGIIFRNPLTPQSKRYFFITHKMYLEFCKVHNQHLYRILTELQFKHKEKLLPLLEEKLLLQS